ncbi:4-hydroxy-tetrahydrodipicolinate reductase [Anianabacter salinae]|uniref:4-hydroxy-tetrahydrodipicolinate reductase n=1 Tax=Anianabacter salinae TaxID=2851023 RepID=UPI00225DF448|nr:4-hydroxy-tetrahydrodipicolinate reductase [Anianabacter salinae]MBV0913365.1 4-hydroxy-tetrahydrodipicolinate reductase [Anianabacter salinae]
MTQSAGVCITGVSGRMGRMLVETVEGDARLHVAAALERAGHDWIGQDLGTAMGGTPLGVTVTDDPRAAIAAAEVVIDFTAPDATVEFARIACEFEKVHVIATTGFEASHLDAIAAAGAGATIIRAGNMSLGVNLLVKLTRMVAAALDEDFDIEVIEAHHSRKVDAPSGTALMLGEAAAEGRGVSLDTHADRGRDGITGARKAGHIGFHAIRGGDIIGEHDVLFAGPGERITLRHVASDRSLFAKGAIKAALWGLRQPAGEYDMLDVLGLNEA